MDKSDSRRWLYLTALIIGNCALALGPYFVRLSDTGPVSAGFWRLFLAVPVLVLFAKWSKEPLAGYPRRVFLAVLVAGVIFALDIASWHIGILQTRLANATLFGNCGSLVLMVWGFVLLRRAPRTGEWIAIIAALAGASILLGRSLEISLDTLMGDVFCIFAGLCYAGYLVILQTARKSLGSWSLLAWSSMAGAPVLLAIALLRSEPFWPHDWTPVIALAISSQIIGQGLLVYSLKHFPPLVIGLALLTQPALASLVGWMAFNEQPGGWDALGMILLALALVMARSVERRSASTSGQVAATRP